MPVAIKDWPQVRMFRTLMRVNDRILGHHNQQMRKHLGYSASEFDLIAALGNTAGMRMKDLAEAMITSPANVTRVASALEKRGMVERARSQESQREVVARLTPAGEQTFTDMFEKVANFTARSMDAGLTPEEQQRVVDLLQLFLRNTDEGGLPGL